MTQDNMPDRIYAWLFIEGKQSDLMKGGWNDTPDRYETTYLKATPAREVANDMLEALDGMCEMWVSVCSANNHDPDHMAQYLRARAAISKARGENT